MSFSFYIKNKNNNHKGSLELESNREKYDFGLTPYQQQIKEGEILFKGFNIKPLAKFSANLKVLGVENYNLGKEAELSPVDFAVGWGVMKDEENLKNMKVSQGGRWYFLKWDKEIKLSTREIMSNTANIHIIPKSEYIEKIVKDIEVGDEIEIGGHLVLINKDNWRWVSSLTRTDTGAGSCEILFVDYIKKVK